VGRWESFLQIHESGTDRTAIANLVPLGHKVVIIGATYAGCEMALFLKERGREVTIVESLGQDNVAREIFLCNRMHLLKLLEENKIEILTNAKPLKSLIKASC